MSRASLYDDESVDVVGRMLRFDPGRVHKLRTAFFKKAEYPDRCLQEIPAQSASCFAKKVSFHSVRLALRADSLIDGATKLLMRTTEGYFFETVILRAITGRTSLCVSCQCGCAVGCTFCATGSIRPVRNLDASEIVDQVSIANRLLKPENRRVRNLVFMGMGEPLHNAEATDTALRCLSSPRLFDHPPSRILVSTVGIPDRMESLAMRHPGINIAISLHSADNTTRTKIIPLARSYSLSSLRNACLHINRIQDPNKNLMVEYLMLKDINDSVRDIDLLLHWLTGIRAHVNLIPYNRFDGAATFRSSPREHIECVRDRIRSEGYPTTIRYSMGKDIDAACGQLALSNRNKEISAQSL